MLETNVMFRKFAIGNTKLRELSDQDIKGIQAILLETLSDFDTVCRENNLCYFLAGGSALGSERHKGFIPWDEDLDIGMPRKDYNRLAELFLEKYEDFSICTDESIIPNEWKSGLKDGMLSLLPSKHKSDGFFICCLKRKRTE